jgi:hypothetical protein
VEDSASPPSGRMITTFLSIAVSFLQSIINRCQGSALNSNDAGAMVDAVIQLVAGMLGNSG